MNQISALKERLTAIERSQSVRSRLDNMNRADSQTRALSKLGLSNVTQESPLTSNLRAYEINLVEQMLKKKIV